MKYIIELLENLETKKQDLNNKNNLSLLNLPVINLEEDVLTQITIDDINTLENLISNLDIEENKLDEIKKSIEYYKFNINLGIKFELLIFRDSKCLKFIEDIKFLYTKVLEYKNQVICQYNTEIEKIDEEISTIKKCQEIFNNSGYIDLNLLFSLLNTLSIDDILKSKIYIDAYNQNLELLKKQELSRIQEINIEQEIKEQEAQIEQLDNLLPSEDIDEIEERIESEGVNLDERELNLAKREKKLESLILNLIQNRTELYSAMASKYPDAELTYELSSLQSDIIKLYNDDFQETYLKLRSEVTAKSFDDLEYLEFSLSEIEEEYEDLVSKYQDIKSRCQKKYNINPGEVPSSDDLNPEKKKPVILWLMRDNDKVGINRKKIMIDNFLEECKKYKATFYQDNLIPALRALQSMEPEVFQALNVEIATISDYANRFKEVKVYNGSGNGACRIYYNEEKTPSGEKFSIVVMLVNKHVNNDLENYRTVSDAISPGNKKYASLLASLDDPEVLKTYQELYDYIFTRMGEIGQVNYESELEENDLQPSFGGDNGGSK